MITDIELIGFQGHTNSNLSLSKGLNVIIGESDSGKSSIIRALTWVLKNKPKGDSFRNNSLSKKDIVVGSIAFDDDTWVTREKSDTINQYLISSSDGPLKALRADLPTEVEEITRIKDVNIQSQHPSDQYFMLTESPGNVAKKFNDVAGLTIMDEALSEINSSYRKTKQDLGYAGTEIERKGKEIKALNWVDEADVIISGLILADAEIVGLINKAENIENLTVEYKTMQENLRKYQDIPKAQEEFLTLQQIDEKIEESKKEFTSWKNTVLTLKLLNDRLTNTELLAEAKNDFLTLNTAFDAQEKSRKETDEIKNLLRDIKYSEKQLLQVTMELKDIEKEWESHSGERCPLCDNIIGG